MGWVLRYQKDALANLHHTFGILNDKLDDDDAEFNLGQDLYKVLATVSAFKNANIAQSCKCSVNLLKLHTLHDLKEFCSKF